MADHSAHGIDRDPVHRNDRAYLLRDLPRRGRCRALGGDLDDMDRHPHYDRDADLSGFAGWPCLFDEEIAQHHTGVYRHGAGLCPYRRRLYQARGGCRGQADIFPGRNRREHQSILWKEIRLRLASASHLT